MDFEEMRKRAEGACECRKAVHKPFEKCGALLSDSPSGPGVARTRDGILVCPECDMNCLGNVPTSGFRVDSPSKD